MPQSAKKTFKRKASPISDVDNDLPKPPMKRARTATPTKQKKTVPVIDLENRLFALQQAFQEEQAETKRKFKAMEAKLDFEATRRLFQGMPYASMDGMCVTSWIHVVERDKRSISADTGVGSDGFVAANDVGGAAGGEGISKPEMVGDDTEGMQSDEGAGNGDSDEIL